ncbi:MAG: phospholipid carrier-dependent glycosyltransferase [Phycisphaerae bacterium]
MRKHTERLAFLAIAVLYLSAVNNHWAVKSDSGLYLSLGRSLAEGRGMESNGKQCWGIPPVVPLSIAGSRLLVEEHYWLINLAMSLFGFGVVVLSFLTVKRLAVDLPERMRTGLAVGVLLVVGTSARLFIDSTRILTDVPFTFFVMLGLYAFVRGRKDHWSWFLCGSLAFLLATWTRVLGLVLFSSVFLAALWDAYRERRVKHLAAVAGGAAIVATGFLVWAVFSRSHLAPGGPDYIGADQVARFNLLAASKWAEIAKGLPNVPSAVCSTIVYQKAPWFNLLPTALVLVGLWTAARLRQWIVVLPIVLYVGVLIVLGSGAVASRYFLPIMPLLVYCLLLGVCTVATWLGRQPEGAAEAAGAKPVRPGWGITLAIAVCVAISTPRVIREIYWMRHPQFYATFDKGRWQGYMDLGAHLRQRGRPETDRVLAPRTSIVHYLSRMPTDTYFQWKGRAVKHFDDLRPAEFAEMAAEKPYRFVVVPTDKEGWSEAVMSQLRATGLFGPPVLSRGLACYERLPAPRGAGFKRAGGAAGCGDS